MRRHLVRAVDDALATHTHLGERIWKCDGCGRRGIWDDGWTWYGHYRTTGGMSAGEQEVILYVACKPACQSAAKANACG